MIKLGSCPICDSTLLTRHPQAATSPPSENEQGLLVSVVTLYDRCIECGIVFQNPRMHVNEINEFYSSGKYRKEVAASQERQDEDEKERAEIIGSIIENSTKDVDSHLDVGCSRGYLLSRVGAQKKLGVDLNPKHCTEEGIEVVSSLDDVKGKFDIVTIIHTLEHVTDPVETLKKCASKMEKEGLVIVEVPGAGSPGGPLRLAHTYFFEPWALIGIAKRAGLSPVGVILTNHILVIFKRSK